MEPRSTRTFPLAIAVAALAFLFASSARGAENKLILRATAVHLIPDLSYRTMADDGLPVEVDSDADTGWGLGFEFLPTDRLGIAFQLAKAGPSVHVRIDGSPVFSSLEARDRLEVWMYAASLNLHLTSNHPVDLYVSPVLAYMSFDNLEFRAEDTSGLIDTARFAVKRDITWGIGVGLDIPFGKSGWLATASATYLDSTLQFTQLDEPDSDILGFDPVFITAGVGYRF